MACLSGEKNYKFKQRLAVEPSTARARLFIFAALIGRKRVEKISMKFNYVIYYIKQTGRACEMVWILSILRRWRWYKFFSNFFHQARPGRKRFSVANWTFSLFNETEPSEILIKIKQLFMLESPSPNSKHVRRDLNGRWVERITYPASIPGASAFPNPARCPEGERTEVISLADFIWLRSTEGDGKSRRKRAEKIIISPVLIRNYELFRPLSHVHVGPECRLMLLLLRAACAKPESLLNRATVGGGNQRDSSVQLLSDVIAIWKQFWSLECEKIETNGFVTSAKWILIMTPGARPAFSSSHHQLPTHAARSLSCNCSNLFDMIFHRLHSARNFLARSGTIFSRVERHRANLPTIFDFIRQSIGTGASVCLDTDVRNINFSCLSMLRKSLMIED